MKTALIQCLCCSAAALLLAHDVFAQPRGRSRRFGGARPARAEAPPEPKAEEKDDKVESWTAIQGGDVYLGTGQLIRRATVLVGDDKIHAVGHDLDIPEGAKILDATGKVVAPGFVAVKASGFGEPRSQEDNVADAVNPFEPNMKLGLAAGVTSFLTTFGSGTDKPGGRTAVIKLSYGDHKGMVLAENTVYSMRVPLNPSQWQSFRETVKKAKEALKKAAEAPAKEGGAAAGSAARGGSGRGSSARGAPRGRGGSSRSSGQELTKVLQGKARLWVTASTGYDNRAIRQALEVSELLGQGVVLDGPVTAWSIPDEVAATGSMAIINPRDRTQPDPSRPNETGANIASAARLSEAGVPVAVTPPGGRFGGATTGRGGILGQDLHTLHVDAAFAVRGGLDNRKALRTITLDAARILGVDDRVGSIEVGKDADLLILDGDPLHYRTFVETALVNGKVVYEKDKEPFYSHIKR